MTTIDVVKMREHRGRSPDAYTDEVCPCTECHTTPRRLTVYESCAHACVQCLNAHPNSLLAVAAPRAAVTVMNLEQAHVPKVLIEKSWGTWVGPVPTARDIKLTDWIGQPWSVYLCGAGGTGKTHCAVSIVRAWIERRFEGELQFRDCSMLMQEFREAADVGSSRLFDHVVNVRLLVLDDLGAEYVTEWSLAKLSDIIRMRYAAHKATVITSNRAPSELSRMDQRVVSRLSEGLVVQLKGEDYRLRRP